MVIFFLLTLLFLALYRKKPSTSARGFLSVRSGAWRRIRNEHLEKHGFCAICGSDENLTVHHIQSFSEHPELELCPDNLITLCENKNLNCHFVFGHKMRWTNLNRELPETIRYMHSFLEAK